jgi:lipopolysaccharide heptosyltransferase I
MGQARLRGPALSSIPPQRIALVKPSALGDVVHALPVLTALRLLYPRAEIAWIVNRSYAGLLSGHPHLDRVLVFDRGVFSRGSSLLMMASYAWRWGRYLRQQHFDWVIDLQGLLRSGWMTWVSGAAVRVGLCGAREGSLLAYTHRVVASDWQRRHAVERNWAVIEALGGGDLPRRFVVPIARQDQEAAQAVWQQLPRPWIAVAPAARWPTKSWPPAAFAELLARFQRRFGAGCLIVGSESDQAAATTVARALGRHVLNYAGHTTIAQLAALLAQCDLFVGNDSGPLHLAAALYKPCLAPYTCTRPQWHGPYTWPQGAVAAAVACAGSYRPQCPHLQCHSRLTPEELWSRFVHWQRTGLFPWVLPAA